MANEINEQTTDLDKQMDVITSAIIQEITEFIETQIKLNLTRPMPPEGGGKAYTITDTGELLKSIEVEHGNKESTITITAPQGAYNEFGTNPHTPPLQPLIKWARRKLGKSEEEAEKTARAIQFKISKVGSQARPFTRPAIQSAKKRYVKS